MNILIVSNMYPSEQKPYSGLFVLNQVNTIQNKLDKNDTLNFYYMKRTFTNKIGSIIKYIKFFINFIFFIRKKNITYDIVHIHYYFPTIYIALLYKHFFNKNVKIIVTFHGGDFHGRDHTLLYKYPFKYVDIGIGVSTKLSKKITKYISKNKVFTFSAGINDIFKNKNKNKKVFDIIYVGSFFPVKGFDIFCKVIKQVNTPLNICVVGSGKLKYLLDDIKDNTIHKISLFENKKQFELVELYNSSKFLLNTSRKEGFGLVLSEAMSCGTIPIATMTDGAMEQLIHNINGFLVKQEKKDSLTIDNIVKTISKVMTLEEAQYTKMLKQAITYGNSQKLSIISIEIIKIYKDIYEKN